jgi:hypothetical protein
VLVPPPFCTVTDTGPAVPTVGATAVMVPSSRTVKVVGKPPKKTFSAPVNPLPERVTLLPPVIGPVVGVMLVRVGAVRYWNREPLLKVEGVLTVMATAPVPGGEKAVMRLSDTTVKEAAGVVPKKTPVAFINPAPFMFTVVPPVSGP